MGRVSSPCGHLILSFSSFLLEPSFSAVPVRARPRVRCPRVRYFTFFCCCVLVLAVAHNILVHGLIVGLIDVHDV